MLITHSDTDHYSVATYRDLKPVCHSFDSTKYVTTVMQKDGLPGFGYGIGDAFNVGPLRIQLTPVEHDRQNAFPRPSQRHFEKEDRNAVKTGLTGRAILLADEEDGAQYSTHVERVRDR